jgi:calcineurin-like phosphoesterase family protein
MVKFISDLHLGHKSMAIKRGFKDVFEHDEYIIKQWNKVTHKRDVTYILGDITMENSKSYYRLDSLNGRKYVVLGNHDRRQDIEELLKYVDGIAGMIKYKEGCILTHCPIHPCEMDRFSYNIHGHVHENTLEDKRYINVSAEVVDYTPQTLEQLIN